MAKNGKKNGGNRNNKPKSSSSSTNKNTSSESTKATKHSAETITSELKTTTVIKSVSKTYINNNNNNDSSSSSSTSGEHSNATQTTTEKNNNNITVNIGTNFIFYLLLCSTFFYFLLNTYFIRLQAIQTYGPVIHEFDPYFNYRATEYLYYNGWKKFFTWFDHQSWYPLGRPVGTTIYPGMQFTAVFIKQYIVGNSMSLNDVCCYIPAWFGVIASIFTGLIAYECSLSCNTNTHIFAVLWELVVGKDENKAKSKNTNTNTNDKHKKEDEEKQWKIALVIGVFTMGIMGVVPAHMMRSVGGGYDNESIAVSTMMMTFYFWVRSLRGGEKHSYLYGFLTGLAYFYMVATWGGYVFVVNMIGIHAALLVALGRFTTKVYLSYSIFYVIGTALAIQIPVVGLTPLKSLEQLSCAVVFIGYQVLFVSESIIRKKQLSRSDAWKFRIRTTIIAAISGIILVSLFLPSNYFGPISSRVRGLFVKHTKTGNPLVDSVAEHQPAKSSAYFQYLHQLCTYAPVGFFLVLGFFGDSPSFLSAFAIAAYFFSLKMVRLILLIGPISSILSGIVVGRLFVWSCEQLFSNEQAEKKETKTIPASNNATKKKKAKKNKPAFAKDDDDLFLQEMNPASSTLDFVGVGTKRIISFVILLTLYFSGSAFRDYSWSMSRHLSNPSIIQEAKFRNGTVVQIDDYREAYWWIRDNTPEDARVMAWWDYGYQIAAIANRTTIADGNTWNHEHIALLGKVLTTDIDEAYSIARHLADYVLVWAGGGGDDLAKSPHLARITNSVYRDFCPGDPACTSFGLVPTTKGNEHLAIRPGLMPSPKMRASLIHHLVRNGLKGVEVNPEQFIEVFRSKYAKVRVYKIVGVDEVSKAWAADPKNKVCDAPGSWFCRGQYPPALREVLDKGKTFVQLEDFNKKDEDSEYQKQYMESMNNQRDKSTRKQNEKKQRKSVRSDL